MKNTIKVVYISDNDEFCEGALIYDNIPIEFNLNKIENNFSLKYDKTRLDYSSLYMNWDTIDTSIRSFYQQHIINEGCKDFFTETNDDLETHYIAKGREYYIEEDEYEALKYNKTISYMAESPQLARKMVHDEMASGESYVGDKNLVIVYGDKLYEVEKDNPEKNEIDISETKEKIKDDSLFFLLFGTFIQCEVEEQKEAEEINREPEVPEPDFQILNIGPIDDEYER